MEAPLHPSIFETSVGKLTVDGRPDRRDHEDLFLGELNYVYFVSSGSYIPLSLVLPYKKRGLGVSWRTHSDFG